MIIGYYQILETGETRYFDFSVHRSITRPLSITETNSGLIIYSNNLIALQHAWDINGGLFNGLVSIYDLRFL